MPYNIFNKIDAVTAYQSSNIAINIISNIAINIISNIAINIRRLKRISQSHRRNMIPLNPVQWVVTLNTVKINFNRIFVGTFTRNENCLI